MSSLEKQKSQGRGWFFQLRKLVKGLAVRVENLKAALRV
jgi:hypothetical protein